MREALSSAHGFDLPVWLATLDRVTEAAHRHGTHIHSHTYAAPHRHLVLLRRSEPVEHPHSHQHVHPQEHDEHGHSHGLVDRSILRSHAGVKAVTLSLAILGADSRYPGRDLHPHQLGRTARGSDPQLRRRADGDPARDSRSSSVAFAARGSPGWQSCSRSSFRHAWRLSRRSCGLSIRSI